MSQAHAGERAGPKTTALQCADCHAEHHARRSDAKYCGGCRLLKQLTWAAAHTRGTRGCVSCGTRFRPIHARDQHQCGTCEAADRDPEDPQVDCAFCHKTAPPALRWSTVRCCVVCVKSSAKAPHNPKLLLRSHIINALQKGRRDRKAAHASH